jgi:hypothetical protein
VPRSWPHISCWRSGPGPHRDQIVKVIRVPIAHPEPRLLAGKPQSRSQLSLRGRLSVESSMVDGSERLDTSFGTSHSDGTLSPFLQPLT